MALDLVAMDPEILSQLLPVGDSAVTAAVTIFTAVFTYAVGRRKSNQELQNMEAEKRGIEASSEVTTAEAAQIISAAAAATVQPLVERVREQREEIKRLSAKNLELIYESDSLRTKMAEMKAENELMKRKFIFQGEIPPTLPLEEGKES